MSATARIRRQVHKFRPFSSKTTASPPQSTTSISRPADFNALGPRLRRVARIFEKAQQPSNEEHQKSISNLQKSPRKHELNQSRVANDSRLDLNLSHSMPEWIAFVDRLVAGDYFSKRRGDRVLITDTRSGTGEEEGSDVKAVLERAFANFAYHRVDLFRALSRGDIKLLVVAGCPSLNSKIITSSKRLRSFVGADEGEVCSKCSMRNSCSMSFMVPQKKEVARTVDVVRLLFVHGHQQPSSINTAEKSKKNKGPLRRLLGQLVELSKQPFDPDHSSLRISRNFGWNVVELKKGDWMCEKCEFMNFAKHKSCLRCAAPPPRRKLRGGEWGCPGCGYINYKRNQACHKCECNRPMNPKGMHNFDPGEDEGESGKFTRWKWTKPEIHDHTSTMSFITDPKYGSSK